MVIYRVSKEIDVFMKITHQIWLNNLQSWGRLENNSKNFWTYIINCFLIQAFSLLFSMVAEKISFFLSKFQREIVQDPCKSFIRFLFVTSSVVKIVKAEKGFLRDYWVVPIVLIKKIFPGRVCGLSLICTSMYAYSSCWAHKIWA